ncbi:MAG: DNA gyrase modulator, partial [Sulfolobales archaeon]
MIDEQILIRALDLALSQGATYAEVRFQEDVSDYLVMRNGKVLSLTTSIARGIGIRVLVGGALGFAATDR